MSTDTFFELEAKAEESLVLPQCTVAYRRELFTGRGVGIYFDEQPPASWPEHAHSQLELMFLGEEAECDFAWQGRDGTWRQESLKGPQICVIAPQVPHSCVWRKAADMILLYVEPGVYAAALRTKPEVWVHEFAALAGHDLVVWQLVALLKQLGRQMKAPGRFYVESMGAVLAAHLVRAHVDARSGAKASGGLAPSQLERVTAYITDHLSGALPVAKLAKEAGVSPYHFIRLFKLSTGLTPRRYVLKCRLLKAKELLETREFRVAEAAYETGFCDQSHLNRHFRKFFGFTPKAVLRRSPQQYPKL